MAVENTASPWVRAAAPSGLPAKAVPSSRTRRATLAAIEHHPSAVERGDDAAAQGAAGQRRVAPLRREALRLHRPLRLGVQQRHVGGGAGGERAEALEAPVEAEGANGADGELFDQRM